MRILEYAELDKSGIGEQYAKTVRALEKGDFRSAKVKKLMPRNLYRAELGRSDRLLFKIMRHGTEGVLLVLEVIRNHDYAGSRFLRGADVAEGKIPFLEVGTLGPKKICGGELPPPKIPRGARPVRLYAVMMSEPKTWHRSNGAC